MRFFRGHVVRATLHLPHAAFLITLSQTNRNPKEKIAAESHERARNYSLKRSSIKEIFFCVFPCESVAKIFWATLELSRD